ncbi:MAG: hypothetical protein AB1778_09380 [Candidatus Bipolaricaulota bacterium]
MNLEEGIQRGIFAREPAKAGELQQLLAALTRRLDDARRPQNHPDTQLDQVYLAILTCALAALRNEGVRPVDPGVCQPEILDSLEDTLHLERLRIDTCQRIRELRGRAIREGVLVAPRDVAAGLEEAIWLAERLQRWLEDQDRVAPLPN